MQPVQHQQQTVPQPLALARRALGVLGMLLAALLLGAAGGPAAAQDIRFFRIGTGTTGGTYFPIGGMIAGAISRPPGSPPCELGGSCGVPGLIAVAQASSGSVENIAHLRSGAIEAALCQADVAFWAFSGSGLYAGRDPMLGLRAIANLYHETAHVVVPAGSPIRSIPDLAGRRVAVGEQGSGILVVARLILQAYGLSEQDITAVRMAPEPAGNALAAGALDAIIVVGGAPFLAVDDLARRMPIRLVPLDGEGVERLLDEKPFYTPLTLPAGTYPGVEEETATIGVGALFVISDTVDAETAYGITRALWHPTTQALLSRGHPRGREIRLSNALNGVPIPIHPGALRYYREAGLLSPPVPPMARGQGVSPAPGTGTPAGRTPRPGHRDPPLDLPPP